MTRKKPSNAKRVVAEQAGTDDLLARAVAKSCPHGDPYCPCQDGDACHYEWSGTTPPMRCPTSHRSDGLCCQEYR